MDMYMDTYMHIYMRPPSRCVFKLSCVPKVLNTTSFATWYHADAFSNKQFEVAKQFW